MTQERIHHLLTNEDLRTILADPAVLSNRAILDEDHRISSFDAILPEDVRRKIFGALRLPSSSSSTVPMRWIVGDTPMHADRAWDHSDFTSTHLIYLTDSEGRLVIGDEEYPIQAGDGYIFSEGLLHGTKDATSARLLMGPFNESLVPVGYFGPTYNDGTNSYTPNLSYSGLIMNINEINTLGGLLVVPAGKILTGWTYDVGYGDTSINDDDPAIVGNVYPVGATYVTTGGFSLTAVFGNDAMCFREGTQILVYDDELEKEIYRPIEELDVGQQVKTYKSEEYKTIAMIGYNTIENPAGDERIRNRLYHLSPDDYPELLEDLYITGSHSVLVDTLTPSEKEDIRHEFGKIFVTEDKYRLMACVDKRARPWSQPGSFKIFHFALEDENKYRNFGVYANGLLVETTFKMMFEKRQYLTR